MRTSLVFILLLACHQPDAWQDDTSHLDLVGGLSYSSLHAVGSLVAPGMRCTGTLIAPDQVLTAAHCLRKVEHPEDLGFLVGPDAHRPIQRVAARAFRIHPSYSAVTSEHDIAVVYLEQALTLKPLPLASWSQLRESPLEMFVVGYGAADGGSGRGGGIKRAAWLPITEVTPWKIRSLSSTGQNICHGDSGGPALVAMPETGEGYAVLAVSIAGSKTDCTHDSIFAQTEPYRTFIEHTDATLAATLLPVSPCGDPAQNISLCADINLQTQTEGPFRTWCRFHPWASHREKEDCTAKGHGWSCRAGKCQSP